MNTRWAEGSLYVITVTLLLTAGWGITHPVLPRGIALIAPSLGLPPREHPTTDSLADAIALIAAENLFRPERASASDAESNGAGGSAPPVVRPPKPNLVLRGVLGGPPWDAILDGIPGHAGSVVLRTGQRFGELEVRAVRHDTVFIRGMDTTWTLTLRHP
ncbi:MAG: hypothetical protein ACRENC_02765 [Gemmatimonadaceae bacterium]